MESAALFVNLGIFIGTVGAAAVAWWQAVEASRSRTDAREAQKAALTSWQDASSALIRANEITGTSLRGPYAWALNDLGTALLSARLTGATPEQLSQIVLDRMSETGEKAFAAGDAPTDNIARWISYYPREVDLGSPPSIDAFMDAAQLINDRVRLWLRDPEAAHALVRDDPQAEITYD